MSTYSYASAHRTPTGYSDDIVTPFHDIGMASWNQDQIAEFFAGKNVADLGSGFEGIARRLFAIFGNTTDAPRVTNINPQFTDWRMLDTREGSIRQSKKTDIEDAIKVIMEMSGEDYDGYFAQRIAVEGLAQQIPAPDDEFDVIVSTWAFPNCLYDCGGNNDSHEAGYKEILRVQRPQGIALLAPIRAREKQHTIFRLETIGRDLVEYSLRPATAEGDVLELRHAT